MSVKVGNSIGQFVLAPPPQIVLYGGLRSSVGLLFHNRLVPGNAGSLAAYIVTISHAKEGIDRMARKRYEQECCQWKEPCHGVIGNVFNFLQSKQKNIACKRQRLKHSNTPNKKMGRAIIAHMESLIKVVHGCRNKSILFSNHTAANRRGWIIFSPALFNETSF